MKPIFICVCCIFCLISSALPQVQDCAVISQPILKQDLCSESSHAAHVNGGSSIGWFVYRNHTTNRNEIALNITWLAQSGLGLQITPSVVSVSRLVGTFTKCEATYSVKKGFNRTNHHIYITSLSNQEAFRPSQEFVIKTEIRNVSSFFQLSLPNCRHPNLSCASECQRSTLEGVVHEDCKKRSANLSYRVPGHFGSFAQFIVYEDDAVLYEAKNVSLKGDLTTTFADIADKTYYFEFWGYDVVRQAQSPRKKVKIDFSQCPSVPNGMTMKLIAGIAGFFVTLKIICVTIKVAITKCDIKNTFNHAYTRLMMAKKKENGISVNRQVEDSSQRKRKVFLIYVNDHPKHKEVTLKLASFLKFELYLDVLFELYANKDICSDPMKWMDNSFEQAEKVVVVWSPEAEKRWSTKNCGKFYHFDMFIPIVQKIQQDMSLGKNVNRYLFVHFNYCQKAVIPMPFDRHRSYELMNEFVEFCHCLKSDANTKTTILPITNSCLSRFHYRENRVKYNAAILSTSVEEMSSYVKENPDWYRWQVHRPKSSFYVNSLPPEDETSYCLDALREVGNNTSSCKPVLLLDVSRFPITKVGSDDSPSNKTTFTDPYNARQAVVKFSDTDELYSLQQAADDKMQYSSFKFEKSGKNIVRSPGLFGAEPEVNTGNYCDTNNSHEDKPYNSTTATDIATDNVNAVPEFVTVDFLYVPQGAPYNSLTSMNTIEISTD